MIPLTLNSHSGRCLADATSKLLQTPQHAQIFREALPDADTIRQIVDNMDVRFLAISQALQYNIDQGASFGRNVEQTFASLRDLFSAVNTLLEDYSPRFPEIVPRLVALLLRVLSYILDRNANVYEHASAARPPYVGRGNSDNLFCHLLAAPEVFTTVLAGLDARALQSRQRDFSLLRERVARAAVDDEDARAALSDAWDRIAERKFFPPVRRWPGFADGRAGAEA